MKNHNVSSVDSLNQQFNDTKKVEDITPQQVLNEISSITQRLQPINLFSEPQTANAVLKEANQLPDPVYLYPYLLIENEFTILFADTGIGKTVFAVQIGNYIAKNGKRVLLLDLELSKKQFEKRYKDSNGKLYQFSDNFFRVEYERLNEVPKDISYLEFFIQSIKDKVEKWHFEVVIIDNLTKLSTGSTDNAKDTIPIIEALNKLKVECGLTILALEHNKKVASDRPIELNDLQGSKMKSNLCDSVFSIGKHNQDSYLRYIKQVKVRSAELEYDIENVLKCELTNKDGYLHFEMLENCSEWEFIRELKEKENAQRLADVLELKKQGISNVEIAKTYGVSEGAVRKWLRNEDKSKQSQ